ncbi:HlyD family efflux transporter periplasmic adaptor subunit [Nonomuraea jiangxiensis]|nr:peptidoglycan-binding domain-containing protein [Nonomuraea jiangxiensis]
MVAAVTAWIALPSRQRPVTPAPSVATQTAPVTRGTITERIQVGGTLGYEGDYSVVHQGASAILTSVPTPGSLIERGEPLYSVDGKQVRLLYGDLPAYRAFEYGMTSGPDVRQLERNLVRLGLDPDRRIDVDDRFTHATSQAIRAWEARWGVRSWERTGRLPLGTVAFLPRSLRVAEARAEVGSAVSANSNVLTGTSNRHVVTVQLSTDRQHLVKAGDSVEITLSGVKPLKGTVIRVGRVATQPRSAGNAQSTSLPAAVPVTIGVTLPKDGPSLDQAPVQAGIATMTRKNVLTVPVTALLARSGGGYEVRLASNRLVKVEPGLFDSSTGMVEVAGELSTQDQIKVPVQ